MADSLIEIQPDTAKMRVTVGVDGVWLHFATYDGRHATINMQAIVNMTSTRGVIGEALHAWTQERVEQAKTIRALERA